MNGVVSGVADAQLLAFARVAGFAFRAPGFSHPAVPPPVRAAFAFTAAAAFARASTTNVRLAPGALPYAVAGEAAVGAAIGMAASLLYDGAFAGGRTLDDYVGIRGSVPNAHVDAGAGFGRLWSLAFAAAFFVLGGYRPALSGLAQSFASLPLGTFVSPDGLRAFAMALPTTIVRAALFVAGPAIAIAFATQLSLATVARVVPRFSTFALAFPVVFACAVLATIAALPLVLPSAASPWMDLAPLVAR